MSIYYRIVNRLKRIFVKPVVPPTYEFKRSVIDHYRKTYNIKVLIENGTFFGDTVDFFKNDFDEIYSIELAEDLAKQATDRFAGKSHIKIIHGDSAEVLKSLVPRINKPILFWLDGHYSSEFFVGEKFIRTARGKSDTPILEELDAVLSDTREHVILIDDARLFTGLNDYPSLGKLRRTVGRGKKWILKSQDDIIQITPRKND
jgi:hypothetical protein